VSLRRFVTRTTGSTRRLFAVYAVVSLVPVAILGAVLLHLLAAQSDAQGLAEGSRGAALIQRAAIAPLLPATTLASELTPSERSALNVSAARIVQNGQVVRLRLRNLSGQVVFSYGAESEDNEPDDGARAAAAGHSVAELTYLNEDDPTSAGRGPRVVEVYQPLVAPSTGQRIGVVELYLPYAPIAADIKDGQSAVTAALGLGLIAVWAAMLAVSVSVTSRLRREAKLNAVLANNDSLTGLANRGRFMELIGTRLAGVSSERPVAIAVLDIDRFKEINDTLGHDNGDQLIQLLATRLSGQLRDTDIIARIGGDEFGIVLTDVGADDAVRDVTETLTRVRKALAEPVEIGGLPLAAEASVGFALAPRDGVAAGQLMQRADVAMYVAKHKHLGIAGYTKTEDHYSASGLRLVAELGDAIEAGELVLHYQPKLDLARDEITSIEALVRWNHPSRGLLYPDAFLPAVEQTELIEPLTWWVMRRATLDLAQLDPTGRLTVAVNISARSLIRPDFAEDLLGVLIGTGTDPHRVVLEVTETMLLADPPRAAATLRRLHDAGFQISIDDFGAGQTSLGYLAMLPISELKIDKSFVFGVLEDERNAAIVRSVIELGHSLGLSVIAEGVETEPVLDRLRAFSCDKVQGYFISKPLPLDALRDTIALVRAARG
jgi:diguanylate cyclase (GGDEF)-like protein